MVVVVGFVVVVVVVIMVCCIGVVGVVGVWSGVEWSVGLVWGVWSDAVSPPHLTRHQDSSRIRGELSP